MALCVNNISYSYDGITPVLCGLSFSVERGETVSVLGHSGCGKTTLARHLNGLIVPQSGTVSVDGALTCDGANSREIMRRVALMFQFPEHQMFAETVLDEIAYASRNWKMNNVKERVYNAMNDVGLDMRLLEASPYSVSGGEKRLVAIASLLAHEPNYIIFDEPTACLDYISEIKVKCLIKKLSQKKVGVVCITHDIDMALDISDKIIIMERGKIIAFDTPPKIAELLVARKTEGLRASEILRFSAVMKQHGYINSYAWSAEMLSSMLGGNK